MHGGLSAHSVSVPEIHKAGQEEVAAGEMHPIYPAVAHVFDSVVTCRWVEVKGMG